MKNLIYCLLSKDNKVLLKKGNKNDKKEEEIVSTPITCNKKNLNEIKKDQSVK